MRNCRLCKPLKGRDLSGAGLLFFLLFLCFSFPVQAAHVICIDPGHGGENHGTENVFAPLPEELSGAWEKELTMITAEAMRDRLLQYEDVEVVMTRTSDIDLSLEERAKIAIDHGAEFLFSVHYNASASLRFYGSEVWVSAFGQNYVKGMQFGLIETKALKSLGLIDRGVKTKISGKTDQDYYGIIKHAGEGGVPAAILEHCHVDNPVDYEFYDSVEELKAFGELDADCVAEYLGLSSAALGIDFSDRVLADIPEPLSPVYQDMTEPDFCSLTLIEENTKERRALTEISAQDADGPILYYTVSFDGGETESGYQPWPEGKDTIRVNIEIPYGIAPQLVITAYNRYDLGTASEPVALTSVSRGYADEETLPEPEESAAPDTAAGNSAAAGSGDAAEDRNAGETAAGDSFRMETENLQPEESIPPDAPSRWAPEKEEPAQKEGDRFVLFLQASLVAVFLLFGLFLTTILFSMMRRKKRRKPKNYVN